MRLYLLSLLLISSQVFAVDYSTLSGLDVFGCEGANQVNSPIIIQDSLCGPYSSFSLSLQNTTFAEINIDNDESVITGGPTFAYANANVLSVNGTAWSAKQLVFRSPAENRLFSDDNPADYELQILLQDANQNVGQLSFLIRVATNSIQNQALNTLNAFSTDGTSLSIDFGTLSSKIQAKIIHDIYLNLWTYNGTLTYPNAGVCAPATWFIYGSELYINNDVKTIIDNFIAYAGSLPGNIFNNNSQNARPTSGTGGGSGTKPAERLCYTGYFKVTMGENYGLWFAVTIILFFFIVTLVLGEKPISNPDYQENAWTHHPLISLRQYGNDLHTRKSRAALFLATLTVHGLFSAIWYENASPKHRTQGSNVIIYAIYSMICSWIIVYILGNILRGYYEAKHQYHKTRDETWNQKSQNRIFGYYFGIFLVTIVGWAVCVWKMNGLHAELDSEVSDMWVATFFIGIALELLIVDPIVCVLAGSVGFIRTLAKRKAYMYDHIMHETYMLYLKVD